MTAAAGERGPVVCFGEMLLRLSPPGAVPLAQAGTFEVGVGGAEANVAAALAGLGTPARMVTALPDNPLGRKAKAALGAAGVDTRYLIFGEGRIGLYFLEPPAGPRGGRVTYDRAGSVFALAAPADFDFAAALGGARLLHVSGITPALGPGGCALIRAAVEAARAAKVPVSFDGNYRGTLWEAWDSDPRAVLGELVGTAQILLGNHRDISLLLGRPFSGDGPERRREAVEAAFAAFPGLELVASTARHVVDGGQHRLAARVDTRGESWQTEEIDVTGIVDRIGTGDAFAAGVLHRHLAGASPRECAEAGLALAALKHGVPGDMLLAAERDLEEFRLGRGSDVRR
jgi:2-dehydro-3-deoxygluconokinase